MAAHLEGIALGPQEGELIARGAGQFRILAELTEFEVIDVRFGPLFTGVPLHAHDDNVDSFFVLEGEAEFTVGGTTFLAGPRSYVAAPAGVQHGFRNAGQGDLHLLNIHAPKVGFAEGLRRK